MFHIPWNIYKLSRSSSFSLTPPSGSCIHSSNITIGPFALESLGILKFLVFILFFQSYYTLGGSNRTFFVALVFLARVCFTLASSFLFFGVNFSRVGGGAPRLFSADANDLFDSSRRRPPNLSPYSPACKHRRVQIFFQDSAVHDRDCVTPTAGGPAFSLCQDIPAVYFLALVSFRVTIKHPNSAIVSPSW